MVGRIKQLLCRHRYADEFLEVVEVNQYKDTVRFRNYCVKCGKPYEISISYNCLFGEVVKTKESNEESTKDFFTREDVRKMTRTEVRENYEKIIKSMERW